MLKEGKINIPNPISEAVTTFNCSFLLSIHHQTVVTWENEKLVCVQKGEKKNRGWKHWIEGEELHLVRLSFSSWCRPGSAQTAFSNSNVFSLLRKLPARTKSASKFTKGLCDLLYLWLVKPFHATENWIYIKWADPHHLVFLSVAEEVSESLILEKLPIEQFKVLHSNPTSVKWQKYWCT